MFILELCLFIVYYYFLQSVTRAEMFFPHWRNRKKHIQPLELNMKRGGGQESPITLHTTNNTFLYKYLSIYIYLSISSKKSQP